MIDQASSHFRSLIQDGVKVTPWLYHPPYLDQEAFVVPDNISRFLTGLLTGDTHQPNSFQRINRLIDSFS